MIQAHEEHREELQAAAARASGIRRSQPTTREKSQIIRSRGLAAYQALPW
jgi:hypothetical protein